MKKEFPGAEPPAFDCPATMTAAEPLALPPRLRQELTHWETIQPLAADGSDRRFFRLQRRRTACICLFQPEPPGSPVTENDSYYFIGQHLRRQGLPVPEVFEYCREEGWFLVEDLGETSLQTAYLAAAGSEGRLDLYRQAVALLVQMQVQGSEGFSPHWCFDTPYYDANLAYTRECQYFVAAFLERYLPGGFDQAALEADFAHLLARALEPGPVVLLHRDFQSRNLLWHQGRLWIIDFQGARLGPPHYDLAALLLDPYVQLPAARQEVLVEEYLQLLGERVQVDPAAWRQRYRYLAICRNLQMLGAYGFLSGQKGRPFFRQFIPAACQSLVHRLDLLPATELPTLRRLARQVGIQGTYLKY